MNEACLAEYRRQGKSVFEVPARRVDERETFVAWVARVGNPLAQGWDVIYQMPFMHDGVRGIADFLVRVVDPKRATSAYEPVDAKLARIEAKPGHVLQLCFYADAIEALTGVRSRNGCTSGWGRAVGRHCESTNFGPYWRRLARTARRGARRRPERTRRCRSRARTVRSASSSPLCERAVAGRGLADLRRGHPRS